MAHEFLEEGYAAARKAGICEGCPGALRLFERIATYSLAAERRQTNPSDTRGIDGLRRGAQMSIDKVVHLGAQIERDPCEGFTPDGECGVEAREIEFGRLVAAGDYKSANDVAERFGFNMRVDEGH